MTDAEQKRMLRFLQTVECLFSGEYSFEGRAAFASRANARVAEGMR
jgi:hypothetical protein